MCTNNKCAVKKGKKHTDFFQQSRGVRQGCSSSPTLFNINQLARTLEQSAAPGITLVDTEIKCLLFADDLVLLSPTKEGLQQHLDLLHSSSQTWALTVNLSKTKIMIFEKRPRRSRCSQTAIPVGRNTTMCERSSKIRHLLCWEKDLKLPIDSSPWTHSAHNNCTNPL